MNDIIKNNILAFLLGACLVLSLCYGWYVNKQVEGMAAQVVKNMNDIKAIFNYLQAPAK